MATYRVLEKTSETLVSLLEKRLLLAGMNNVEVRVVTTSAFSELRTTSNPVISIFLYQVAENTETRNAPRFTNSDGLIQRQPLGLELGYLITPWGARRQNVSDSQAAAEEMVLIGLILQTFYDAAEVGTTQLSQGVGQSVWQAGDAMQIIWESLPIEDHYRIWDSSELGYRLSLTYRVRVLGLAATPQDGGAPVTEASFGGGS